MAIVKVKPVRYSKNLGDYLKRETDPGDVVFAYDCNENDASTDFAALRQWSKEIESDILANLADISCLELIPENFFYGRHREFLTKLGDARTPVAIHGVELSIGTLNGFKDDHLRMMLEIADQVNAVNISDHLAMTEAGEIETCALTPLDYSLEVCDLISSKIERIQSRVKLPFLVENVAHRFFFPETELSETQFINKITDRTGCGLLLDLHNIHTSAVNFGIDPYRWLDDINLESVGLVHLAGGFRDPDGFLQDSHDNIVPNEVWELYKYICQRIRPPMTVIERTSDFPFFDDLMLEISKAESILLDRRDSIPSYLENIL